MSIKTVRWIVNAGREESDYEALREAVSLLYSMLGLPDDIIEADLEGTSEADLRLTLGCYA